jgi:hypothetical protein
VLPRRIAYLAAQPERGLGSAGGRGRKSEVYPVFPSPRRGRNVCKRVIFGRANKERSPGFWRSRHGIRVNSVNPTVVLTDMGKRAWSDPEKGGRCFGEFHWDALLSVKMLRRWFVSCRAMIKGTETTWMRRIKPASSSFLVPGSRVQAGSLSPA